MRVRVSHCLLQASSVVVDWRRGGEGLGGTVTRGQFAAEQERLAPAGIHQDTKASEKKSGELTRGDGIEVGQWSAWTPLESICGRAKSWVFPSVTVSFLPQGKKTLDPPQEIAVDFEFADERQVFKRWTECAPRGATVGFAFPSGELDGRGAGNAEFVRQLAGIAAHVKARRELLEKRFPEPVTPPSHFAILGHLAGYGQGPGSGVGKAIGFGVRHCNPEIVAAKSHLQECPRCRDEFREYLRRHRIQPMDVGARNWDEVAPYPLWATESTKSGVKQTLAAPLALDAAADRLRYYYSYRFMTYVTASLFPESARRLAAEGIPLYAMQGNAKLEWEQLGLA